MTPQQQNAVNSLNTNPMFRFSMSSLELFHSNFLEWLFDLDHVAFLNCFSVQVNNTSQYSIKREYYLGTTIVNNNKKKWITDIAVFENGNLILIIENKVKSMPSNGQLANQSHFAGPNCTKVLLSLFNIPAAIVVGGFSHILYQTLVQNIRQYYASNSNFNPYIKDYCDMMNDIQNILNNDGLVQAQTHHSIFSFADDSAALNACGLMDAFRKYQAALLANDFNLLPNHPLNPTVQSVTTEHSLNNKHACATITYKLLSAKTQSIELEVGVQVENNQLRIFFIKTNPGRRINDPGVQYYWNNWFANCHIPGPPQGVAKKGGLQYCRYSMSKQLFVYRYVKIPTNTTIQNLLADVDHILTQINTASPTIEGNVLIP
jgi:hypothetical protein